MRNKKILGLLMGLLLLNSDPVRALSSGSYDIFSSVFDTAGIIQLAGTSTYNLQVYRESVYYHGRIITATVTDWAETGFAINDLITLFPFAPTLITANAKGLAVNSTLGQVQIKWLDNSVDETEFRIYRQIGTAAPVFFMSVAGTQNLGATLNYTDDALADNTVYSYYVTAFNQNTQLESIDFGARVSANTPDRTPPVLNSYVINNGFRYSTSNVVSLQLNASDAHSPFGLMRVSTSNGTTWTPWTPFTGLSTVTVPTSNGVKKVYVELMDLAFGVSGNWKQVVMQFELVPHVRYNTFDQEIYNYPNPFSPATGQPYANRTKVVFAVDTPQDIQAYIVDMHGRIVFRQRMPASVPYPYFDWDGRDVNGNYLPNGVYLMIGDVKGTNKKLKGRLTIYDR